MKTFDLLSRKVYNTDIKTNKDRFMSENWLTREASLIGEDGIQKLKSSHVMIFGLGGVGSYACEGLSRSGVGTLTVIDGDKVDISNINRQLIADTSTIGQDKAELCKNRISLINAECKVNSLTVFADESNTFDILNKYKPDFILDCIDTVKTKLLIAKWAYDNDVKMISCMGTGNKLDPSKFVITDINKTSVCPLARAMRTSLKKMGVKKLPVLFSTEVPVKNGRTPSSISFVPSVAGLMMAGYAIRSIIKQEK